MGSFSSLGIPAGRTTVNVVSNSTHPLPTDVLLAIDSQAVFRCLIRKDIGRRVLRALYTSISIIQGQIPAGLVAHRTTNSKAILGGIAYIRKALVDVVWSLKPSPTSRWQGKRHSQESILLIALQVLPGIRPVDCFHLGRLGGTGPLGRWQEEEAQKADDQAGGSHGFGCFLDPMMQPLVIWPLQYHSRWRGHAGLWLDIMNHRYWIFRV